MSTADPPAAAGRPACQLSRLNGFAVLQGVLSTRSEVELAILGAAHEGIPLCGREDQRRTVGVLRVADRDRLVDERDFHTVVGVGTAAGALEPLRPAQVDPETLRFNFHNGSSTSNSII